MPQVEISPATTSRHSPYDGSGVGVAVGVMAAGPVAPGRTVPRHRFGGGGGVPGGHGRQRNAAHLRRARRGLEAVHRQQPEEHEQPGRQPEDVRAHGAPRPSHRPFRVRAVPRGEAADVRAHLADQGSEG